MSQVSGGPGWWLASDGRWYPPESRPQTGPPPPPPEAPHSFPGPYASTVSTSPAAASTLRDGGSVEPVHAGPDPWVPQAIPDAGQLRGRADRLVISSRPVGWGGPPPASRSTPGDLAAAAARSSRPQPARGSGNVGWAIVAAVLSALTVLLAWRGGSWYLRRANLSGAANVISVDRTLKAPAKLMAVGYGGWRMVIPVLAVVVFVGALLAAAALRHSRYSRPVAWSLRIAAVFDVAAIVTSMVVRVPQYPAGPLADHEAGALAAGVVLSYLPGWTAYATLATAVLMVLATAGITVKVR